MKHLKRFDESIESIDSICRRYGIENYTINPDGSIDVDGNVDLSMKKLTKLPLKFNKVSGFFNCSSSQLITLEGCPKEVGGSFYCEYNKLISSRSNVNEYDDISEEDIELLKNNQTHLFKMLDRIDLHQKWTLGIMGSGFLSLFGLMIHGFHWIS